MAYTPSSVSSELAFSSNIQTGATGMRARRVQEWLTFHGHGTPIDADFGPATKTALKAFQASVGVTANGIVNRATWDALTAPLVRVCSATVPSNASRDAAVLRIAKAHLAVHPIELGGENCGPWVRAYCGSDGEDMKWCAGFVTFVLKQACSLSGHPMPVSGSVSCDTLAAQAKANGNFVRGKDLTDGTIGWDDLGKCQVFLVRRTASDWIHTGFSFEGAAEVFKTIEGNTDHNGSSNGFEVAARTRSIKKKDFISLV